MGGTVSCPPKCPVGLQQVQEAECTPKACPHSEPRGLWPGEPHVLLILPGRGAGLTHGGYSSDAGTRPQGPLIQDPLCPHAVLTGDLPLPSSWSRGPAGSPPPQLRGPHALLGEEAALALSSASWAALAWDFAGCPVRLSACQL